MNLAKGANLSQKKSHRPPGYAWDTVFLVLSSDVEMGRPHATLTESLMTNIPVDSSATIKQRAPGSRAAKDTKGED